MSNERYAGLGRNRVPRAAIQPEPQPTGPNPPDTPPGRVRAPAVLGADRAASGTVRTPAGSGIEPPQQGDPGISVPNNSGMQGQHDIDNSGGGILGVGPDAQPDPGQVLGIPLPVPPGTNDLPDPIGTSAPTPTPAPMPQQLDNSGPIPPAAPIPPTHGAPLLPGNPLPSPPISTPMPRPSGVPQPTPAARPPDKAPQPVPPAQARQSIPHSPPHIDRTGGGTPESHQDADARWTEHARFRFVGTHEHALHADREIVSEQIVHGTDGLYPLHPKVAASLHAHLQDIQSREWTGITLPQQNGQSQEEKDRHAQWERDKQSFGNLVQRTIVGTISSGEKITAQQITEPFAYQLYTWMQECIKPMVSLYASPTAKPSELSTAFSLLGISGLPTSGRDIASKRENIMQGLWKVYQDFYMHGTNSPEAFIRHVAREIKARNNGKMDRKHLYSVMDIYRQLPLFGKDGNLMHAMELAIEAISQERDAYPAGFIIKPIDRNSREGQVFAFIQEKIPQGAPPRRPSAPGGTPDDDDDIH